MFKFLRSKADPGPFDWLKFFQENHYLDPFYLNDLNGKRTSDPKIQAELNRMVDIACLGAQPAKIQAEMCARSRNPYNMWELGYVFGCLDAHKIILWKCKEFSRSFFHCGFMSYYPNAETARRALLNAGAAITGNDVEFLQGAKVGKFEAVKMISDEAAPSGLMTFLSERG